MPVTVVVSVMAGVVVGVATEAEKPLAVTTDTEVTVPVPPPAESTSSRCEVGSAHSGTIVPSFALESADRVAT